MDGTYLSLHPPCGESNNSPVIISQEADLKTIENRYILSMGAVDFIRYHQELYNLDTREWGARFICTYLERLEKQYMLISLVLGEMENRVWLNEMENPDLIRVNAGCKAEYESSKQLIAVLNERQRAIAKEIKDFLAADFWETRNIPRPIIKLIPDPELIKELSLKYKNSQ
jgi:hypothetical protein